MRAAGSPETKRRYCQKFSPGPARRRPCRPWMTVAATRRASSISRGIEAASVRPAPTARPIAAMSGCVRLGSTAIRLSDPCLQASDHGLDAFAFGARRERERHAVLEHRLGKVEHVIDRGGKTAVEQSARTHCKHQRLTGARARAPRNQFGGIGALRT